MNMFEQATREKIRFAYRGLVTVEDLWDLKESELNVIYMDLAKQLKTNEIESLINPLEDGELTLKMNIVKHIFTIKKNEALARRNATAIKAKNQKILEIIDRKQNATLEDLDVDELRGMLEPTGLE